MSCDRILPLTTALADGELDLWSAWRVRRHLAGCRACRAAFEDSLHLRGRLQGWRDASAPAGLEALIGVALGSTASAAATTRSAPPVWAWTGGGLAVGGLAALVAGLVVSGQWAVVSGRWWTASDQDPVRSAKRIEPDVQGVQGPDVQTSGPSGVHRGAQGVSRERSDIQVPGGHRRSPITGGLPSPTPEPSPAIRRPYAIRNTQYTVHSPQADPEFLDGREATGPWAAGDPRAWAATGGLAVQLPRMRDDFVRVPLPRVASTSRAAAAAAISAYAREAEILDTRLFRKITLQSKGVSLEELCLDLEGQTGVEVRAQRGIRDEKVTVFVKDVPARDVMRAVARLHGYFWARSGADGSYKYELNQDLRSQLTEEELRNQDLNAALIALDEEMGVYRPYLNASVEALQARLATAKGDEKNRLQSLVSRGGWGGMQLYARLSPEERLALRSGQELSYGPGQGNPDRQIPPDWQGPLVRSFDTPINYQPNGITVGKGEMRLHQVSGAQPSVRLKINRSELGQLSLNSSLSVMVPFEGGGQGGTGATAILATGRSPSVAKPDNAGANAALKKDPRFQKTVSLKPKAAKPDPAATEPGGPAAGGATQLTTAEVWQAVHEATGMPVVADYYTRLYPVTKATVESASLFDALCQEGDVLGVRWKADGAFLLCRSTSYFWDKLKEVPNRLLRRWQADRVQHGGLPLADLVEMSGLSSPQLNSERIGQGIAYLWGLGEWSVVAGEDQLLRKYIRFLSVLSSPQREKALSAAGLGFSDLTPAQQQLFLEVEKPMGGEGEDYLRTLQQTRIFVGYVPRGWHYWSKQGQRSLKVPVVAGRTQEAALDAAQQANLDPNPSQILRSEGDILFLFRFGNRTEHGQTRFSSWYGMREPE